MATVTMVHSGCTSSHVTVARMNVNVRILGVEVLVQVEPAACQVPQYLPPERYEHQADGEFEVGGKAFVRGQELPLEPEDDYSDHNKRDGMTEPPRNAYPDAPPETAPATTDNGRHGNDMVGVSGMLETEQKSKSERCCGAGSYIYHVANSLRLDLS